MLTGVLGDYGKKLLYLWILTTFVLYFSLPIIVSQVGLTVLTKFKPIVAQLILFTIALWGSQSVITMARAVTLVRAASGRIMGEKADAQKTDAAIVQRVSLWSLGIATTLTAFMTQWFA